MIKQSTSSNPPLWKRIAAFLGLVAVLSAMLAPAVTLAEEVRTGKLGGLCSASKSVNAGDSGDVTPAGSHCDACGSFAFALPSFKAQTLPSQPGQELYSIDLPFDLVARISGLPPGRGPPAL